MSGVRGAGRGLVVALAVVGGWFIIVAVCVTLFVLQVVGDRVPSGGTTGGGAGRIPSFGIGGGGLDRSRGTTTWRSPSRGPSSSGRIGGGGGTGGSTRVGR